MKNKYKYFLITILVLLIFSYPLSAMYSFHQFHKGIYHNDKNLTKEYVKWDELRNNFKDYFNAELLKKTQKDESFKDLGNLRILFTGFAGKIAEYTIDAYLNPEGLNLLLKKYEKKNKIPKPNFSTFIGSISVINFDWFKSFYVNYENEGEKFPVYFNRFGIKWKITKVEFPENLFDDLNKKIK